MEVLVKRTKKKLKQKQKELLKAERSIMEASGSRGTNPESEKEQWEEKIKAIKRELHYCAEFINMLKNLPTTLVDPIGPGSLVKLRGVDARIEKSYLVVPKSNRCSTPLKIKGQEIGFISVKAPVGQAILSLKTGNTAKVNGKQIEIISIQ